MAQDKTGNASVKKKPGEHKKFIYNDSRWLAHFHCRFVSGVGPRTICLSCFFLFGALAEVQFTLGNILQRFSVELVEVSHQPIINAVG